MTLKKAFLATAAVAALCVAMVPTANAVSQDSGTNRIIGGTAVPEGAYPWMVKVEVGQGMFIADCNGTLISRDLVLTTGGCFSTLEGDPSVILPEQGAEGLDITVIHGSSDTAKGTRQLATEWRSYLTLGDDPEEKKRTRNNGYANDWALIKLKTPIDLASYPQLSGSKALDARAMYQSMGWGLTKDLHANPGTLFGTQMHEYQLPAWADKLKDCYGYAWEICAGWPDNSKYNGAGDAGAPLIALPSETPGRILQIGIMLTENERPGLQAQRASRLSYYIPAIKKAAEDLKGAPFTVAQ